MSQYNVDKTVSGSLVVETLTGNSGGAIPPTADNINILGAGSVTVAGNAGTSTLTISVSGSGLSWNSVAGTAVVMTANNGYVPQNIAQTTLELPLASAFGDAISIIGFGSGGWIISQGAGQQIIIGSNLTTSGPGGSLASSNRYDSLNLICLVPNTIWATTGGPQTAGFTIV